MPRDTQERSTLPLVAYLQGKSSEQTGKECTALLQIALLQTALLKKASQHLLHILGFEVLHDRALQEAPGSVVGGHDVGFSVPSQLLQRIPAATQPGLAVRDPVEALAVCMEAVAKAPHLRHDDEVLPVKSAPHTRF